VLIAVGGVAVLAVFAAVAVVFRRGPGRALLMMRVAAGRLGGRVDPATGGSRAPALLAEVDGLLVRAAAWPADADPSPPPYLEICTPVEGVVSPVVAFRRDEAARLALLFARDARRRPPAAGSVGCVAVFCAQPAPWCGPLFDARPSWMLLELDARMLRVLTNDPRAARFGAVAIEGAVREFAAVVPSVLEAAGVTSGRAQ
jgi:hypothetical protein